MLIAIAFIILLLCYSLLMFYYWRSWTSIPLYKAQASEDSPFISVIIPARNEEKNIGQLLSALSKQTWSRDLFEVIVVDDHSTDDTALIADQYPGVKLIRLENDLLNSYKKKAIETGILAANGKLIVTTDADCIPALRWLETIAGYYRDTGARFIVSPVDMRGDHSFVELFQSIDFMVMQGITGGSVSEQFLAMCNGANLAYEKQLFLEVDGFKGIDHIASGDDMLLMQKVAAKHPGKIGYLKSKDAIVETRPAKTWTAFLNQRIRWASKATNYKDKRMFFVLLLVYLFNVFFILTFIAGFWNPMNWVLLASGLVIKTLVELPLVHSVSCFFGQQALIRYFFVFQPLHIIYIVISGLFGQFGTYEWKGRKVK
jgi:biofilm PGA synthesis N-glycosyltransferase PgaC